METKVNQIDKFLDKDYKVKISYITESYYSRYIQIQLKILDELKQQI